MCSYKKFTIMNTALLLSNTEPFRESDFTFDSMSFDFEHFQQANCIPLDREKIGNIRPIILTKEGVNKEDATSIKLLIYGSSKDVISEITIHNLNSFATPSAIIELLYNEDSTPIKIPYPDNKNGSYEMLPVNALKGIINFCKNNGATIITRLGRTTKDIVENYQKVCKLESTRTDKISELQINKDNLRILHPISEVQRLQDISWIDVDTQYANQLDNPDALEKFILENHPKLLPNKDWNHTILDFRNLTVGPTDCEVERSKLMIIIGEDRIITVHDGSLDFIENVRSKLGRHLTLS